MGIGERSGAVALSLQEETLDEEFIESPQIQMYLLTEIPGPLAITNLHGKRISPNPCYK